MLSRAFDSAAKMCRTFVFLRFFRDDLIFFFFNDTAPTEIYTLSLHDALPICDGIEGVVADSHPGFGLRGGQRAQLRRDRKSTRLNSSHANISYAVFCLKKKNTTVWVTARTTSSPKC